MVIYVSFLIFSSRFSDLKPQNLVLSSKVDPKIKLIDFGFSTPLLYNEETDQYDGELKEMIYTPGFGAPEILAKQGYGKEVDMWSFGVIVYQLLTGSLPFSDYNSLDELFTNYEKNGSTLFPVVAFVGVNWDSVSTDGKDFLEKLLQFDPSDRLTAEQALEHPWFTTTNDDVLQEHNLMRALKGIKEFQMGRLKKAVKKVMAMNLFKAAGRRRSSARASLKPEEVVALEENKNDQPTSESSSVTTDR
jgi:serine/threonine protein kinase